MRTHAAVDPGEPGISKIGRQVFGPTQPGQSVPCPRSTALTDEERRRVVDLIAMGRAGRHSVDLPVELRTRHWDSVLAVMLELSERLPGTPAGWKVGAASEEVRRAEKLPSPAPGRLYAEHLHPSGSTLPEGAFINYRNCECEFAFRMARGLPARDRPYERDEVEDAIECLIPVIELGDMVFDDWYAASGYLGTCLDNGGGAAVVLGERFPDWRSVDLANASVRLSLAGTEIKTGWSSTTMGHPTISLTWVANWLRERGRGLEAGDLVSTGTCTGHCFAARGDTVRADFGPLGAVEVTFG